MLRLEIFFGWFGNIFFLILVTKIITGSFWHCSQIYVQNWRTLFYMIKICCNLGRNQIFGDIFFYQFQMSKFFSLEGGGGNFPSLPIDWWNGGSGVENEYTFKGGLRSRVLLPLTTNAGFGIKIIIREEHFLGLDYIIGFNAFLTKYVQWIRTGLD